MPTVECEVHNIELKDDFVIDTFPDDALTAEIRIKPTDDHKDAVSELSRRHRVSLKVDADTGTFVAETDSPPAYELRFSPVTTARAELQVRRFDPRLDADWHRVDGDLAPVRHILSFIYRRSINFVRMEIDGQKAPTYDFEPNSIAGNLGYPLFEQPRRRRDFVCAALPAYRKALASSSPFRAALPDGLLHYLSHTREGLRISERLLMLFIALEVLSNAHAQETNTENILPEDVFYEFERQMRECLDFLPDALAEYPDANVESTKDVLRTKMGTDMKRNSIRQKIKALAVAHGLDSYCDLVGGWIDARNGFVHEGRIGALALPVEERRLFWEDCIARLAGFLERVLVTNLSEGAGPGLCWFSDSWEEGADGGRWKKAEQWPPK